MASHAHASIPHITCTNSWPKWHNTPHDAYCISPMRMGIDVFFSSVAYLSRPSLAAPTNRFSDWVFFIVTSLPTLTAANMHAHMLLPSGESNSESGDISALQQQLYWLPLIAHASSTQIHNYDQETLTHELKFMGFGSSQHSMYHVHDISSRVSSPHLY